MRRQRGGEKGLFQIAKALGRCQILLRKCFSGAAKTLRIYRNPEPLRKTKSQLLCLVKAAAFAPGGMNRNRNKNLGMNAADLS